MKKSILFIFSLLLVLFLSGCIKEPAPPAGELSPGGPQPHLPPVKIDKNLTLANKQNNSLKPKLKIKKELAVQINN